MIFEFDDAPLKSARMKVVGVGGAGGNAVNRMIHEELEGVEFISANTDQQALKQSRSPLTVQLGTKLTRGLGAGARPEIGRQAIAESADEIRRLLEGADLVFIAAGMGGGTGTGAAPIIGEIARELGALCVAIVTRPFSFEGQKRMRQAEQGLAELRRTVDTTIVVPNDRLLSVVGKGTSFRDALKKADEVLLHATQGISDLIRVSGDVNVDFADVRTIMASRGPALMGSGYGEGDNRAQEAAQEAISSPLLDDVSISGAQGVLINITGGMDLALDEVALISSIIQEEAGHDAEIIFGAVHDPTLEGSVRVTVIATGFDDGIGSATAEAENVLRPDFRRPVQEPLPRRRASAREFSAEVQPRPIGRIIPEIDTRPFHRVPEERARAAASGGGGGSMPLSRYPEHQVTRSSIGELDIPTFVRRSLS